MIKTRVLVVDDSVVFRRVLTDELSTDPEIEVVGSAANGRIAIAKMKQVNPDLVILDVEMPEMDGLETLAAIRKDYPKLPVIMFSATTEQGASSTLDALALGATDYFTKPTGLGSLEESRKVIREELVPSIKAICKRKMPIPTVFPAKTASESSNTSTARILRNQRIEAVVIGISTGGPNALAELFQSFPGDLRVPILIVQHMPPMFTKLLAERLSKSSKVSVEEATMGMIVQPGKAYVAPGDYHMALVKENNQVKVSLNQDPPENSCRPAADPMFRSAVKAYGGGLLAVVMTGMGQDGLRGCEAVRAAGGQIIVQDELSSVVWGMPGFVAKAGLADKVLPLALLGHEIVSRVNGKQR